MTEHLVTKRKRVPERPEHILGEALAALKHLYERSLVAPDEVLIVDRMRDRLPTLTRMLFESYLQVSGKELHEPEVRVFLDNLLAENFRDWTLSTPGYPIFAREYGESKFNQFIRIITNNDMQIADFERVGLAFFDGNGIKSMDACIGYDGVADYLRAAARIFTDPQGPTRQWLDGLGQDIVVTPMSVGGDEVALLVHGRSSLQPLMPRIVESYQREIESSDTLKGFVDFSSREVWINYGFQTPDAYQQFCNLDEPEQERELERIHADLPDTLPASFSGGALTLDEAILHWVGKADLSTAMHDQTFDSIRKTWFDEMMKVAEIKQAEDKERQKKLLDETNPKAAMFMRRHPEIRILATENAVQREEIETLRRRLVEQAAEILALEQTRCDCTAENVSHARSS